MRKAFPYPGTGGMETSFYVGNRAVCAMSVKFSGILAIKQIEFIFRIEERNWWQQVLTGNYKHMFAC